MCGWRLWGFQEHFGVGSFDRRGSEEFLFADGGYEFLEVEWFEVCDVLEVAGAIGGEGRGERCCRAAGGPAHFRCCRLCLFRALSGFVCKGRIYLINKTAPRYKARQG